MDLSNLNPLEVLRAIVAVFGLAIDLHGWLDARRRERTLWANQGARIGRGHIMARSNVQTALILAACHGTLLFIAAQALGTPDGAITTLSVISNVGQALVGLLLAAASILLQNAQHDADILDRRNEDTVNNLDLIFRRLDELFDQYAGRTIRRPKE